MRLRLSLALLCGACLLPGSLLAADPIVPPRPGETHWAFRPIVRPDPLAVHRIGIVRTPIDRFILAALETRSLSLSPEADRLTLLRRLSFDLTGLPPTPAELDGFRNDSSPDAYARLVEHYLASPHYGERWGKYWLESAGYADSNGYFNADSDRPLAWKYRDYVIRSLNADKPYDRFVREQLAGDELAGYVPDGDVTPASAELLTATHFLRNAPDGTGESDGNPDEVRTDRLTVLEGTLQITMNGLLGVTIQCARCHEHKFEPIAHHEYYALQAIFSPAYNAERWLAPKDRVLAVGLRAVRAEHQFRTDLIDRQVRALRDSLTVAGEPLREQVIEERLASRPETLRTPLRQAVRAPKDRRTAEQQALLKTHTDLLKVTDEELARRFPEFGALRDSVQKAIAGRERERPSPPEMLSVFVETDPAPPPHHVLKRGQHNAPGAVVEPGVPAAFCTTANCYRPAPKPSGRVSSGRRTAFAAWVTSPENPLFARVMVNRVWQHHFGSGLVSTPDNLGRSGARPSHPELLDYLASEFVRGGWSLKGLHRLILTSAVYRQAVTANEEGVGGRSRQSPALALSAAAPGCGGTARRHAGVRGRTGHARWRPLRPEPAQRGWERRGRGGAAGRATACALFAAAAHAGRNAPATVRRAVRRRQLRGAHNVNGTAASPGAAQLGIRAPARPRVRAAAGA